MPFKKTGWLVEQKSKFDGFFEIAVSRPDLAIDPTIFKCHVINLPTPPPFLLAQKN